VSTIKNKTGDSASGKKRKEVTWSKRDVRNLGVKVVSLFRAFPTLTYLQIREQYPRYLVFDVQRQQRVFDDDNSSRFRIREKRTAMLQLPIET